MDDTAGLLQLLNQIHSQYGLLVLMLVLIIVFGCLLFWKLVWRVWSGALSAKDSQIERLVEERDMYQEIVLESLRTSRLGTKEGAALMNAESWET